MLALWMFGRELELLMGPRRFLIYYATCVVGAAVVQLIVAGVQGQLYPTVGASGGVFGILLAYGMAFPNRMIMLLFPPIPMKAKYFVVLYGLFELYLGVSGSAPGIAHFAHLGGMLFGFLLLRLLVAPQALNFTGSTQTLENLIALAVATAVLVAIPGPNVALTVANSLRFGFAAGVVTVAGAVVGVGLQLALVVSGLAALVDVAGSALTWIKWLGVAYLVVLGVLTWRTPAGDLAIVCGAADAVQKCAARRSYQSQDSGIQCCIPAAVRHGASGIRPTCGSGRGDAGRHLRRRPLLGAVREPGQHRPQALLGGEESRHRRVPGRGRPGPRLRTTLGVPIWQDGRNLSDASRIHPEHYEPSGMKCSSNAGTFSVR